MMHEHTHGPTTIRPNATLTPSQNAITITPRAAQEIKNAMASDGGQEQALRLSAEPGGCAGYQYALSFAAKPEADEVASESGGVKVFVSRSDLPILSGLTIDFVDSAMGSGFHIKNPNARSTCGCGNTFDA